MGRVILCVFMIGWNAVWAMIALIWCVLPGGRNDLWRRAIDEGKLWTLRLHESLAEWRGSRHIEAPHASASSIAERPEWAGSAPTSAARPQRVRGRWLALAVLVVPAALVVAAIVAARSGSRQDELPVASEPVALPHTPPEPEPPPPVATPSATITVCRDVVDDEPVGETDKFSPTEDVFCWVTYHDMPQGTTCECLWSRSGKEWFRDSARMSGSGTLSFGLMASPPPQIPGDYTVKVTARGQALGEESFTVGDGAVGDADMVVCRDVTDGVPDGIADSFPQPKRIYYWLAYTGTAAGTTARCVWYRGDSEVAHSTKTIGGGQGSGALWGWVNFADGAPPGQYTVRVTAAGRVLGDRTFQVTGPEPAEATAEAATPSPASPSPRPSPPTSPPTPPPPAMDLVPVFASVTVPADREGWTDTAVELGSGSNRLVIHATGSTWCGPYGPPFPRPGIPYGDADGRRFRDGREFDTPKLDPRAAMPTAPIGALIACIRDKDNTVGGPILVGCDRTLELHRELPGTLLLRYNDAAGSYEGNTGSYSVGITIASPDARGD